MPSNLKVNVYSVSARFSLRHQPCGITRWRGELIKTAHDGFAVLFPRKSPPLLRLGMISLLIAQQPTCDLWYFTDCVLKKKSVIIKPLHVISLTFSILPTTESNENIWQLLALWNHLGEKSHIEYSPGPNSSNPSFYWFRKMYLRFTESNLSSFISHIVHIVCVNNSQEALGSFQLHTWNVMINTNCFIFFLLFPLRVLHI